MTEQPRTTPLQEDSPQIDPKPPAGAEVALGRWFARVGVVFAVLTVISFSTLAYNALYQYMGAWSKLGVLLVVSSGLVGGGLRLEKRFLVYGRTLTAGGLACLYYTLYAAIYVDQMRVITNPVLGWFLLMTWSASVLCLAERKRSELLSVFSISLAYFSSAMSTSTDFTLGAYLLLAITSVVFLIRNSWAGLSYVCLVGTYAGFIRQFVGIETTGWFTIKAELPFLPAAGYLLGCWIIYTAGILISRQPTFKGGKRISFLYLNNGALALLLPLVAYFTGFGHVAEIFGGIGYLFIFTAFIALSSDDNSQEIFMPCLIQGLMLVTAGVWSYFGGVTRGLLILGESVFLTGAAKSSRNQIIRFGGFLTAYFGAAFLLDELAFGASTTPLILLGGYALLCANAFISRTAPGTSPIQAAPLYYCFLAGVIAVGGIVLPYNHVWWLVPGLAIGSLITSCVIFTAPAYELFALGQLLLILAIGLGIVGPHFGLWTLGSVGCATLLMAFWWKQQLFIQEDGMRQVAEYGYALATMTACAVAFAIPLNSPSWMLLGSVLGVGFLGIGLAARMNSFVLPSQLFLALAVLHSVQSGIITNEYAAWAITPALALFSTGWLWREIIPKRMNWRGEESDAFVGISYQTVAGVLAAKWLVLSVSTSFETLLIFGLSSLILIWSLKRQIQLGVRIALLLDLAGIVNCFVQFGLGREGGCVWTDGVGFLLLMAHPLLIHTSGKRLVSAWESIGSILATFAASSVSVTVALMTSGNPSFALVWALLAFTFAVFGFVSNEPLQRWCGLILLLASISRVAFYDFWTFSDLGRFLTFFAISAICLSVSFAYYKFGDRLNQIEFSLDLLRPRHL